MTPEAGPTVSDLLAESTRRLQAAGVPDARREAIALLAHALGTDRGGVLVRRPDPVGTDAAASARALVAARSERRPLQHLTGTVEFDGLSLEVGPAVLVPRPETEGLLEAVAAAGLPDDARVADLGTGSGCLAIALAVRRPGWRLLAIDLSAAALEVARRNAARHGLSARVELVEGDFDALGAHTGLHAVVSNPPYVSEEEWADLAPEVRDHDPKMALVSGTTGLEAYARIAPLAASALAPNGLLALELGWRSEPTVRRLVEGEGFHDVLVLPDLAGIPRVLTARR